MKRIVLGLMVVFLAVVSGSLAYGSEGGVELVESLGDPGEVTCLVADRDKLWIGTRGAGLVQVEQTSDGAMVVLGVWDARRGVPGNRVLDCSLGPHGIWVATGSGLARIDRQGVVHKVRRGRFLQVARLKDAMIASSDDRRLWFFDGSHRRSVKTDVLITEIAVSQDHKIALGALDGTVLLGTGETKLDSWRRLDLREPVQKIAFSRDKVLIQTVSKRYEWGVEGPSIEQTPRRNNWMVDGATTLNLDALEHLEIADAIQWNGLDVVATDAGAMFRGSGQERWKRAPLQGMPCGARIAAIASFNEALWVGSFDKGLCRLTQSGWTRFHGPRFLASDMVHDMSADAEYLYVATHKGLTRVDKKGRFQVLTVGECVDNPRKKCPWHATVNGVAQDRATGISWMVDTGAVHRMSGRRWKRYYRKAGIASSRLTRVAAYKGRVAVGTGDQGILLMEDGRNFVSITDQDGLADNWITDLHYDEQGTLWVATCTRGLSRYRDGRWRTFTHQDGLADDYILSVRSIRGRVWVGTLRGLSLITSAGIENYTPSNGLSGSEIHDIVEHQGKIYVATDGGLSVFRHTDEGTSSPAPKT